MEIQLNNNAPGRRAPVQDGLHRAQCISVQQLPGTEAPYLQVEYVLIDPNDPAAGAIINDNLSFVDAARWRTDEVLAIYGIDVAEPFDTDDMVGQEVQVYTMQKPWGGVMTTNVQSVHDKDETPNLLRPGTTHNEKRSGLIDEVNASIKRARTLEEATSVA